MSYAIANVVYGVPLTEEVWDAVRRYVESPEYAAVEVHEEEIDLDDPESFGFETMYSGSGDRPGYCGVKITDFDECSSQPWGKILSQASPTKTQMIEAGEKISKLPACVRAVVGEPTLWLVWSSS